MPDRKYLTNKDAITLIYDRVQDEPIHVYNLELIRFIINTIAKVVGR